MYLKKISVAGFKNYAQAEFSFSEKINCIVGDNGTGKTNLLDSIHYLSFCKSFFSSQDILNIRHGDDYFAIHGHYARSGSTDDFVQCIQKKNQRKRFLLNRKEYERLADHIGNYPLVMISPYDRDLINDGSEHRRKYIDSVISQFDRQYLDGLIHYNKALVQRNALLKLFAEQHRFDSGSLDIWDVQLIRLGIAIHARRREFLAEFVPLFRKYFEFLTNGSEVVDIQYISQLSAGDFDSLFRNSVQRDRSAQATTTGIHKDDLDFMIDGYPVKRYGSQGQQKSFVIAVKLAQFEYTRMVKDYKPILLLDDIFDKLDDNRVKQLIRMVSENSFGQVFITDTSPERIGTIIGQLDADCRIFNLPIHQD